MLDDDDDRAQEGTYIAIVAQSAPRSSWRVAMRRFFFPLTNREIDKYLGREVDEEKIAVDWFDALSLLVILVNTVTLAMNDPLHPDSELQHGLEKTDWAFSLFFFVEITVRLMSFGFIIFKADLWNVLDALIVLIGTTSTIMELLQFSPFSLNSLRTVRVLRPLRSIRLIEGARVMIVATANAVKSLQDVGLLYILFLLLFGVSGVSQYNSRIRTRCVNIDFDHENRSFVMGRLNMTNSTENATVNAYVRYQIYEEAVRLEGIRATEEYCILPRLCADLYRAANVAYLDYSLADIHSFDYNTSFAAFQDAGCEKYLPGGIYPNATSWDWVDLLPPDPLMNSSTIHELEWYPDYFRDTAWGFPCLFEEVPSILDLAPLDATFYKRKESLDKWEEWLTEFWESHACDGTNAIILKGYKCPEQYTCVKIENPFFGIVGFDNLPQALLTLFTCVTLQLWYEVMYMAVDAIDPTAALYFVVVVILGAFFIVNLAVVLITVEYERCAAEERAKLEEYRRVSGWAGVFAMLKDKWYNTCGSIFGAKRGGHIGDDSDEEEDNDLDQSLVEEGRRKKKAPKETIIQLIRRNFKDLLNNWIVQMTINMLIFMNIAMMGTEHYGMSKNLEDMLMLFNLIFTIAFTFELLIRMIASEFLEFVRSWMNLIDVAVIIVSWSDYGTHHPEFKWPVVRAVRALRLLNVFKSFPQMYRWITIIIHSLRSSFLLGLMIAFTLFIFSSLGMHLFGGKFCDLNFNDRRPDNSVDFCLNRPRGNFDTIVSAMLTCFVVMTADDWENIMYNGIRARGDVFALYFVVLFIVSNYVLINLLVGILLSVRADAEAAELEALAQARRFAIETAEQNEQHEQPLFTSTQVQLQHIMESNAYGYFILFFIVLSSISLALESPIAAPNTTNESLLAFVDVICNAVFIFEAAVMMTAYGIIKKRWCYLRRDMWNVFDFILVLFVIVSFFLDLFNKGDNTQGPLRALRVLRAIRPFRFVKRSKGLKLVVSTLTKSVSPLGNLLIVIIIVFALWGIMGIQLFKGSFYSCSDPTFILRQNCTDNGHEWVNAVMHFDHLPAAFLSLFTVATLEGWAEIMYDGMDAVGPDQAPVVNNRKRNSLYFVSFVIVGGIFFVNLFVSIIIDSYQKARLHDGTAAKFLTPAQSAWLRSQQIIVGRVPIEDYDNMQRDTAVGNYMVEFRKKVRNFVRHPLFDVVIYCCIVVNFMVMAVDQYPKSSTMSTFIIVMHTAFAVIFFIEAVLKIFAEGWKNYIASKWNKFDFIIVGLSVAAIIMEISFSSATFAASFRTMRALRLLRVIRKSKRLQSVLKKFLFALYSLKNVAAVLLLLFFSFGVMGMKLFGRVQRNGALNNRANFENLPNSMLILMRVSTGGNWVDIMNACAMEPPLCSDEIDSCGLNIVAQIFFVVFMTLGMFILINLFVAVILESFSQMEEDIEMMSDFDAAQLLKLWLHFDPERTYRMESKYLLTFLRAIPPSCPIGMGEIPKKRRLQYEYVFLESLQLQEYNGLIELQDLIFSLCQRAYREKLPEKRRRLLLNKTDRKFRRAERDRNKPNVNTHDVAERMAVMMVEAFWRRRQMVQDRRERFAKLRFDRENPNAMREAESSMSKSLLTPPKDASSPSPRLTSPNRSVKFLGEGSVAGGFSMDLPPALQLENSEATASAAAAKKDEPGTQVYPKPEQRINPAQQDITSNPLQPQSSASILRNRKTKGPSENTGPTVNTIVQRGALGGQGASTSWVTRNSRQQAVDLNETVPEPSVVDSLLRDPRELEDLDSKRTLQHAVRRIQSGDARPATSSDIMDIAAVVHQLKQNEHRHEDGLRSQRTDFMAQEAEARRLLVAEYEYDIGADFAAMWKRLRKRQAAHDDERELL